MVYLNFGFLFDQWERGDQFLIESC